MIHRHKLLVDNNWIYNPESRCYLKYSKTWQLTGAIEREAVGHMPEDLWEKWSKVFVNDSNNGYA